MATLADLRTGLSRDLRDTSNATFSVSEIDDLINQGIDAVGDLYPREIVQTIGTVSAGVVSYAASSYTRVYRLDVYTSAGSYRTEIPQGIGGANTGWEFHGGIIYLPPSYTWTAGDTLRAFGYGRYVQLSASTQTTDLDATATWAVRVFGQKEAFERLISDRVKFQQWQSNSNATDVTALGLAQLASSARQRWRNEQIRLRRMRK